MSLAYIVAGGPNKNVVLKQMGTSVGIFAICESPAAAAFIASAAMAALVATTKVSVKSVFPNLFTHGNGVTLYVTGTGFSANSPLITIAGYELPTTYISPTQLTAYWDSSNEPMGTFDVHYTDGDGNTATLTSGVTILTP